VSLDGDRDVMLLRAEAAAGDEALTEKLGLALQSATKLRGLVELVPPGALPNDGKVIDDTRPVPA
jgi:phenylacetate-CoA ligase